MSFKSEVQAAAAEAFAAAEDAAFDCTVKRKTDGTYDTDTLKTMQSPQSTTGKIIFDQRPRTVADYLAGYVLQEGDLVAYMQGVGWAPKKGDVVSITGQPDVVIVYVDNIARLDAVYIVVLR